MSEHQMVQALETRRLLSVSIILNDPITEYANLTQQVRIAYLPTLTVKHLSALSGYVNWGDGTDSPARFDYNKHGGIDVIATHEYVQPGTFAILAPLAGTWGTVANVVTVKPAPPKITVARDKSFTTALAAFSNSQPGNTFTAKINWGDTGNKSAGRFVTSHGDWQLFAAHVYARPGTYLVHAYVYPHVKGSTFKFSPYDFPTLITVV